MKKFLILLLCLYPFIGYTADTKISALPADTTPGTDSLIPTVDDPAGTPVTKKSTIGEILVDANIPDNITIGANNIGTPTYTSIQDIVTTNLSTGHIAGGTITDAGSAQIDIAAGQGQIRSTDSAVSTVYTFDWSASTGNAIPTNTIRYVGVEYNAGSPQIVIKTTNTWDWHTEFRLGSIVNESDTLFILNAPITVGDLGTHHYERLYETEPFEWASRIGGCTPGETGTRNLTITLCEFYEGFTEIEFTAKDTSAADTFDAYCTTTKELSAQTQWDNTSYCNAGTKTALTANRYANLYIYADLGNDSIVIVYGNSQFVTAAEAEAESLPQTLPNRLVAHGKLLGRLTFQQNDATAIEIINYLIEGGGATGTATSDHTNLANLGWTSSGHTGTANSTPVFDASGVASEIVTGELPITSTTAATLAMTDTQCRGDMHINGDNDVIDYTLPAAAQGLNCCFYALGFAQVITIDTNDGVDTIYLDGTALTAGNAIDSAGGAGDYICIMAVDATNWHTLERSGTWIDGGAD